MRLIKFRAISECKGEHWVYGDLRHYNRNPHTEKWTIHDPATGLETDVDPMTVGQYTGLKDENGVEIYEGDVVKTFGGYNDPLMAVLEWNEADGGFNFRGLRSPGDCQYNMYEFEDIFGYYVVIGNIHDNPELLKEE